MQYKQIILIVAMLSIAVGTIVVLGWIFDISVLKSIVPGYNSMKLNTALSFVVAGVIVHNLMNIQSKSVVFLLCSFLILLNALSLIQDFFSVGFGIDELLILDSDSQIQGSGFPGRSATSTAFCFILLGISLLLIQSQKRISQYLFHLVSIVSFIAIIGYFYDVPAFYRLSFVAPMAVHTAVMFFIFSLGVSLYNPEIGMTGVFTGNGIGNKMARRLFPAIATTILILGFLRTAAHKYNLVGVKFGIALFAISFILVSLFLIWDTTRLLNSTDEKKIMAEAELNSAAKELLLKNEEKAEQATELSIAKELLFQNMGKEKLVAELIRSEERLNLAQSIAKIGSWEFDPQTFKLTWSRAHYHIFELEETPAEKLYDAYRSKIHPDDIPELDRVVNNAIEKGLGFEYEHRVLCKDGSIKNVLGIGQTVTNADGKTVTLHGTAQDITERGKIKNALIQAKELAEMHYQTQQVATKELQKAKDLLDSTNSLAKIGSWDFNFATNNLEWSQETYKIFEINQSSPADGLYPKYRSRIPSDDIERLDINIENAMKNGINFTYEHRIVIDGAADKHILGIGDVYKDEQGNVIGIKGTAQDVTERKKADEKIAQISERLGLATSTANIGIWEYSISNNGLIWDEQMLALYGITSETFSKTYDAWRLGLHPEDRDRAEQELNNAIAGEKSLNTEFRVIWPDKSVHYLQAFAKVIFNPSGEAVKMIGTNYDITDRKQKEKELELLNATKDKFFSIVAHDLKSPLNSLKAFLELLVDEYGELNKDEILLMGGQLKIAVENTIKMADNLIIWARTQMNDMQYNSEPILIQELVNNIYEVYKEVAVGKGINVSCSVEDALIAIGDKNQIEFIIRNLVNNAIKFTSKGGFVNLVAKPLSEGEIEISVSDNGLGMSDKVKAELFSVGKKHNGVGTAGEKGTGLGLMLSYEFIKLNDGQIEVESTVGKGTTFRTKFKRG